MIANTNIDARPSAELQSILKQTFVFVGRRSVCTLRFNGRSVGSCFFGGLFCIWCCS